MAWSWSWPLRFFCCNKSDPFGKQTYLSLFLASCTSLPFIHSASCRHHAPSSMLDIHHYSCPCKFQPRVVEASTNEPQLLNMILELFFITIITQPSSISTSTYRDTDILHMIPQWLVIKFRSMRIWWAKSGVAFSLWTLEEDLCLV